MKIAVIGAGYAGLAAAVELATRGAAPTVYDAARELGGRARRVQLGDWVLDNGQHILSGAFVELLRLMEVVGASTSALLERLPLSLHILPDFRIECAALPGKLGLAAGLLRARGLSWRDRLRVIGLMRRLNAAQFRAGTTQTVLEVLRGYGQSARAIERIWGPLCIGALNTRPEDASAQVFLNVLRDTLAAGPPRSDLLLPRTDLSALFPLPARQFVEARGGSFRLGRAVRVMVPSGGRWMIDDEPYDAIVLAAPPWAAARLVGSHAECRTLVSILQTFRYEPIYTCYLQSSTDYRLPTPMLGMSGALVQWVFDRGQLGGPAGLFAAVVSARGPHESLSLEQFGAGVARELEAALPGSPRFRPLRTIAETRATLRCAPGLNRPPAVTPLRGLVLAGDYTYADYPSTLEGAVRSGVVAARVLTG